VGGGVLWGEGCCEEGFGGGGSGRVESSAADDLAASKTYSPAL